jgi:hypothetical protein
MIELNCVPAVLMPDPAVMPGELSKISGVVVKKGKA